MPKHKKYTYDELWKAIIEGLTEDFIALFLPDLYPQIDFAKGIEFLEQELQKLYSESESKRRRCDKLIKVFFHDSSEVWILIHVEVQDYYDLRFSYRMFQYYYRILDRYKQDNIVALAIFTDKNKNFIPAEYKHTFSGTEILYKYNVYKILAQDEELLLANTNPFAVVVLAALYSRKTTSDTEQRLTFKFRLIKMLLERQYSADIIQKIIIFVNELLQLNAPLQLQYEEQVDKLTNNTKNMELLIERTSSYIKMEKKYIREKQEKEREKQEKEHEKHEKQEKERIIIHSIRKLLEKKFPIDEIAECLGISTAEVNNLIQANKLIDSNTII